MTLRLNWGCGSSPERGWINSDRRRASGVQLPADLRDGLPVRDGVFDYVVSVHALQEIPLPSQVNALAELRRVLGSGGTLRLVLPDLDRGLRAYVDGDREYFLVPDRDATTLGGKLITQLLWYGHSRTLYTFDFVEELMLRAGFCHVVRCAFGVTSTIHREITALDNRPEESLFVEGTK